MRLLVGLMVGVLVLIALAFAIDAYRDSHSRVGDATRMVGRDRIADAVLQSVDVLLAERAHDIVQLLDDASPPENREHAEKARRALESNRQRMLTVLERVDAQGFSHAPSLQEAWDRASDFRWSAGRAPSSSWKRHVSAETTRWTELSNDLVTRAYGLVIEMTAYPAVNDSGYARLQQLRLAALFLYASLGNAAGNLALQWWADPAAQPRLAETQRLQCAQHAVVWDEIRQGLNELAHAATVARLDEARTSVLADLCERQASLLSAAWSDRSVARLHAERALHSLDAMAGVLADVGSLPGTYASTQLEHAVSGQRQALLKIALTLVIGGLVLVTFIRRVVRPLGVIERNLDRLLERQRPPGSAADRRRFTGDDECRRINQALQLLEQTAEERKRSDRILREHERLSASILASLHQAVIATDHQGVITLFSPGAENMLGYRAEDVVGRQTPMIFHDADEVAAHAAQLTRELGRPIADGFQCLIARALEMRRASLHEWTYIRKDGRRMTVLVSMTVFNDDQGNDLCCSVATDITERSKIAAEMSYLANYDSLTQLPNRRLFHDRLRMAVAQARREAKRLALLMIDFDRFKPVNDQYGHQIGDRLLTAMAGRMQRCLRECDTLARVGGDEFVAILPGVCTGRDAAGVAGKIRHSLIAPFKLTESVTVTIDCSIGVAIYPLHGDSEELLLKSADDAMYMAKSLGRSRVYLSGGDSVYAGEKSDVVVPLVWRRSYLCGEESIDREHKELFDCSNALIRSVANGHLPLGQLPSMLDVLIGAVTAHFANEERILERHAYPKLESHAQHHRILVDKALELRAKAVAGEIAQRELIAFVIKDVVSEHMLTEDRDFFPLLNRRLDPAAAAKP